MNCYQSIIGINYFNFYTLEIIILSCGQTSITHHDHIVFIIFEFNDETIIMHTNTLYFSYTKSLNFSSKFEFSGKWQRGFISLTCWIQVFCPDKIQSTDLLQNILCSLFFNNYFVVMILNNGMMI